MVKVNEMNNAKTSVSSLSVEADNSMLSKYIRSHSADFVLVFD